MILKLAMAQALLRKLYEKQAGLTLPIAIGATAMATAHGVNKSKEKAREYRAGFEPGFNPHGGHQ